MKRIMGALSIGSAGVRPEHEEDHQLRLEVRTAGGQRVGLETTSPQRAVLVVNGVSTGMAWSGRPMRVHRRATSSWGLVDSDDVISRLLLWDGERRQPV